jgi:uncharacterized protein YjbI with pentapeptide repeats
MEARFRSILVVAIILVVVIALIIMGYNIDGTGFNGYTITTITKTISGVAPPTNTTTTVYQPGKTIWDWLQLLIIPAVLAVAGFVINLTISRGEQEATEQRAKSEREAAEKRAETEREIAQDNQRETALKEYIDKMAELFLHEDLLRADPKPEVRKIAQIQTLTVLNRLDGKRKGTVLQFLIGSDLIENDGTIIYLEKADLSGVHLIKGYLGEINLSKTNLSGANINDVILLGANLIEADLSEANLTRTDLIVANLHKANLLGAELREAILSGADLSEANLQGTDLSKADLSKADLRGANLKGATGITIEELEQQAKSLEGATMPDGSIHP